MANTGQLTQTDQSRDLAALYRRPFDVLQALTPDKVRQIIPSAKFSKRYLEPNRYYVDVVPFNKTEIDQITSIVQALSIPDAAFERVKQELARFQQVVFFGAGESHGKLAYRIYLGFGEKEKTTGKNAVSIDWVPGTEQYIVKTYDERGSVSRANQLAILQACLFPEDLPDSPDLSNRSGQQSDRTLIYQQCVQILDQAGEDLYLTLVQEEAGQRSSVAFNYYKLPRTTNREIQPQLDQIAKVLELPAAAYQSWLEKTANLAIIDVAVGVAWNGEPFVTIYHGALAEPAAYAPSIDQMEQIDSIDHPDQAVQSATPSTDHSLKAVRQLVYALGELDIDFGTETLRDSLQQEMNLSRPPARQDLQGYCIQAPWIAQSLIWVLKLDTIPIYAMMPSGAYAAATYDRLCEFLSNERIEHISVPGYVQGSVRLMSGQVVPAIVPELRGMYSWSIDALLNDLQQLITPLIAVSPRQVGANSLQNQARQKISEYLQRIYYEYRNLGITPQERALNFSATNAFQVTEVMASAALGSLGLEGIRVEKSPICRPDSECYTVTLSFFNLRNRRRASRIYQFTVDVSDVIPVAIGSVQSWSAAS